MKKNILLLILLITAIDLSAQTQNGTIFNKFYGRNGAKERDNVVMIGLKGGLIAPRMAYNVQEFKELDQTLSFKPAFGFFVEIPIIEKVSVAPEIMYMTRGVNHDNFLFRNRYDAKYLLSSTYIDFRLPFIYRLRFNKFFQPYAFIAPDVAFCLNANYEYSIYQGETEMLNIKDDMVIPNDYNSLDLSVLVGLGFRLNFNFRTFTIATKFDVGYNFGVINTYGYAVENIVAPDLKRYNRPLEFMFSIGLPLKFLEHDACAPFGKEYKKR